MPRRASLHLLLLPKSQHVVLVGIGVLHIVMKIFVDGSVGGQWHVMRLGALVVFCHSAVQEPALCRPGAVFTKQEGVDIDERDGMGFM